MILSAGIVSVSGCAYGDHVHLI